MITCAICGKEFHSITNSHLLYKHGITGEEYTRLYGGQLFSKETIEKKSKDYGIDWDSVALGQKPDEIIAREVGIPRRTITSIRKKKGIPAFGGLILTQEGNPCRSIYEAMYDAYLHWQGIEHQHEVPVPNLPYIADFQIDDQYVEIIGMIAFKKYARKFERKRNAYIQANVNVRWLSIEDVNEKFEDCPIEIRFRVERRCERCGKKTHDLVKNVCRRCYMYVWRENQPPVQAICKFCGKSFSVLDRPDQIYCSHECYAKSLEFEWPSWEWIDEQLETTSIRQLAQKLNVKDNSLYMRIKRRRARNNGKLV